MKVERDCLGCLRKFRKTDEYNVMKVQKRVTIGKDFPYGSGVRYGL